MSDFQQYKDISNLIRRGLSNELDDNEMQELRGWLNECPENQLLFTRIQDSRNYKKRNIEYQKVDVLSGWKSVSNLIEKKRKLNALKRVFRYAATFFLPLLIASGIYYYYRLPIRNESIAVAKMPQPGLAKAVLILDDGKTVSLDSLNSMSITEKDGTLIEKREGRLNYSKSTNEEASKPIYNTVKIPRGGEYNLVLSDGTRVYLNAMSTLKYPVRFSGKHREVELSGEAYFEVTKDASRPFKVKTFDIKVKVLGTSFNINAYENNQKIVTTLVEGSVKIFSCKYSVCQILKPEEQATFDVETGQTDIKKVDAALFTAWKDGILTFHDSRLEDIMNTLVRLYSYDVFYKDSTVKNMRFSGNLNRYGDINQILDIIKSTGMVNIKINGNTILFSKRN